MIRLPWVSRADRDHERDLAHASIGAWKRLYEREQLHAQEAENRFSDLAARYHMLRVQGYAECAPAAVRPVAPPDPIKRAIAQRAGTNRSLREAMERQVATDRLMGKSDEEILSAIIAGVSGEDLILSEAGLMSP